MKNKVPALILALGITASPVFAKQPNRRADTKDSSRIEESKLAKKRVENSYIRQKRIELEKEFIKETEMEINKVLSSDIKDLKKEYKYIEKREFSTRLVVQDSIPANGIDLTEEFLRIKKISESS